MSRRVLMTGATGFLGRHVARALSAQGCAVTSLQRRDVGVEGVGEVVVGDARALAGRRFDWLVHLAAYGVAPEQRDAAAMFAVNVDYLREMVSLAAGWPARAVFVAGSGSEYDLASVDGAVSETAALETRKLYGASKAAGGLCALALAEAHRVPLAYGRIFNVYGAGEAPHRLLPSLAQDLARRRRVPLSAGTQLRDFLHVSDVTRAILALLAAVEASGDRVAVNVCSGVPVGVRAFAESVADAMDAPRELLGFGDLALRPDETMRFVGDPARLHALTGFAPLMSLRDGIAASLRVPA